MIDSYSSLYTPGIFVINTDTKNEWGIGQIQSSINNLITINFENVGKEFAKEARKAHAGDRNQEFYGKPTKKEVKELSNEGIDLFAVPEVKDN